MIQKSLRVILCVAIVFVSGCAHKYTEEQYHALSKELDASRLDLAKARSECEAAMAAAAEMKQKLNQTAKDLSDSIGEKQELLDKNIQCLEEKKTLIKQISQASVMSQEKKEAQARMNKDYNYLVSFLETERLNDQIHIIRNHERIKIIIPQRTLFPSAGSAWLTPRGVKLLRKVTRAVKQIAPLGIEIAGHTDSVLTPETKVNYPTNWHLAHARAVSVLLVFEEARIKKDILTAVSYADSKPIAEASTEEGRAMNRRVEIVITP